jgi:hypothetical protein
MTEMTLSDFPDSILGIYDIEAIHPDVFLSALLDDKPVLFLRGVRTHRLSKISSKDGTGLYRRTDIKSTFRASQPDG